MNFFNYEECPHYSKATEKVVENEQRSDFRPDNQGYYPQLAREVREYKKGLSL